MSDNDFSRKLSQHLLKAPESPFAETLRKMADSPFSQELRALSESPVVMAWRNANSKLVMSVPHLNTPPYAIMADVQTVEAMRRLERFAQTAWNPEIERWRKQFSDLDATVRKFVLPNHDALKKLAFDVSQIVEPLRNARIAEDWQGRLKCMMGGIDQPWAIEGGVSISASAFARIVRLSDAAHAASPYAEPVSELFASELGAPPSEIEASAASRDTAAVFAGLQPDLIAFPPSRYSGLVFTAGFRFNVVGPPLPQAIEAADHDAVYDPNYSMLLSTVERHLRHFVEEKLRALAGHSWVKSRVPEAARRQWAERQEEDRQLGRPVYGLIHYADFMDLANVITRRDNWSDAFAGIFGNSDDLRVSLYRLHPVRKAIAHSRPLCRADVLTLVAEATRMLRAIGIDMLI